MICIVIHKGTTQQQSNNILGLFTEKFTNNSNVGDSRELAAQRESVISNSSSRRSMIYMYSMITMTRKPGLTEGSVTLPTTVEQTLVNKCLSCEPFTSRFSWK